jgi:hypothetical protein
VHVRQCLTPQTAVHAAVERPGRGPAGRAAVPLDARHRRDKAHLAAANLDHLVRVMKRKLKKIRPHLIDSCLTETGLIIEPW